MAMPSFATSPGSPIAKAPSAELALGQAKAANNPTAESVRGHDGLTPLRRMQNPKPDACILPCRRGAAKAITQPD
jgi:hypothetical protein